MYTKGLLVTSIVLPFHFDSLKFLQLFQGQGYGKPSVYHATIIIFLEYFAWGLLTGPMLNVSLLFCTVILGSKILFC